MLLFRLSVLALLASTLCSCGVGQVGYAIANPNDDDANLTAAMDLMVPPLLIIGDWPASSSQPNVSPSHYAALIRTRHSGRMTPERAQETLYAMDEIFRSTPVNAMPEKQLDDFIGPPDKRVVQAGRTMYRYQFDGPQGIQGRWLARK